MKCKECGSWHWDLVWLNAFKEGTFDVHMWQCRSCRRVYLATTDTERSGELV